MLPPLPLKLFDPKTTALIVVDKQGAYMDSDILKRRNKTVAPDFGSRFASLEDFIVKARSKHIKIVWTQMAEGVEVSPEPIKQKMIYDRDQGHIKFEVAIPGKPSYEFAGKIRPTDNEPIIQKDHPDSFSSSELNSYLRSEGITSVILVGGFASRCVLGTAYGANNNDYHVLVLKDLLMTPEQFAHEVSSALSIVTAILGYVTSSEELLASWS